MIKNYIKPVIIALLSIVILCSLIVRIQMYAMNRSLHTDEAAVVESVLTRGYGDLLSKPLLNNQTAPVLYLYFTKITADLLGKTEMSLRLFSFLSLIGLLIVEYHLLKKSFKLNTPLTMLALALTSTLDIYMRYSNEYKPYMGDAFFVVLTLFIYHAYITGKIKLITAGFIYCIILLFSTPSLFFIVSIFGVEFITSIIEKNYRKVIRTAFSALPVITGFIIYYFLWIRPVARSEEMTDFWKYARFDIFAFSGEKIKRNLWLLKRLFSQPFGSIYILYIILSGAGFVISFIRKNKISLALGLTVPILLAASHLEKYPIWERLYLFAYVLFIIYAVICINELSLVKIKKLVIPAKYISVFLGFILLLNNISFIKYTGDRLYFSGQESNRLTAYVADHIKEGEYFYSYYYGNNVVKYKTNYSGRIGNVSHDNVIFGADFFHNESEELIAEDFNKILNAGNVYILFVHWENDTWEPLTGELERAGHLNELMNEHETKLFYFSTENHT